MHLSTTYGDSRIPERRTDLITLLKTRLQERDARQALGCISRLVMDDRAHVVPALVAPFLEIDELRGSLCAALTEIYLTSDRKTARLLFRAALESRHLEISVGLATTEVAVSLGARQFVKDLVSFASLEFFRSACEADSARLFRIFSSVSNGSRLVRLLARRVSMSPDFDFFREKSTYQLLRRSLGREADKRLLIRLSSIRLRHHSGCLDTRLLLAAYYHHEGMLVRAEEEYLELMAQYVASPGEITIRFGGGQHLETTHAGDALDDLLAIARLSDAKVFPTFGTLLGLYREGCPIQGDKDLEFGFLEESERDKLFRHPEFSRYFRILTGSRRDGGTPWMTTAVHVSGTFLDFFHYRERGTQLVTGIDNPGCDYLSGWTPFQLQESELGGRSVHVPEDVNRFLSEHYGAGWSTPDPHFFFPRNVLPDSEQIMRVYALKRLAVAISQHQWAKAAALCMGLRRFKKDTRLRAIDDYLQPLVDRKSGS
jgi:hypothetical protein